MKKKDLTNEQCKNGEISQKHSRNGIASQPFALQVRLTMVYTTQKVKFVRKKTLNHGIWGTIFQTNPGNGWRYDDPMTKPPTIGIQKPCSSRYKIYVREELLLATDWWMVGSVTIKVSRVRHKQLKVELSIQIFEPVVSPP